MCLARVTKDRKEQIFTCALSYILADSQAVSWPLLAVKHVRAAVTAYFHSVRRKSSYKRSAKRTQKNCVKTQETDKANSGTAS